MNSLICPRLIFYSHTLKKNLNSLFFAEFCVPLYRTSLNKITRKSAVCAIEVIRRGIAGKTSNQFGCNLIKNGIFTPPISVLCSSFHKVGKKKSSSDDVCLFPKLARTRLHISDIELSELLNFKASEKQYSVALLIFQEMRRLGAHVNEQTMNMTIHCYCLENKVDFGFAILGSLFKCGYEPGPETFNNLIRGLFLDNKVDEVVILFKKILIWKLCKPDHAMIHTVINGLHGKGRDYDQFMQLLSLLEDSYNEVYDYCDKIVGLRKDGHLEDALQLLFEVIVSGISPIMVTIDGEYHVDSEKAEDSKYESGYILFDHKTQLKVAALEVLADAVFEEIRIMLIEKAKGMSVLEYFMHANCSEIADFRQRKHDFDDSFICDALVNGYCLLGHIDKAKEVLDCMVEMGHKPSIFSYGGLIIENCKKGNVNEAWNLFLQVSFNGLKHNIITYNTMLYGLFREGRFDDGWKLFVEMSEMADNGHKLSDYTYNIVIYGLCRNQPIDEAFSFICEMEDEGIYPDIESYEIIIDALCKDGKPQVARDVLKNQLSSKNLSPRKRTYNMIIGSLCREGFSEDAKSLFVEMVQNGVAADHKTYNMVEGHDTSTILKFSEGMEMDRKWILN